MREVGESATTDWGGGPKTCVLRIGGCGTTDLMCAQWRQFVRCKQ